MSIPLSIAHEKRRLIYRRRILIRLPFSLCNCMSSIRNSRFYFLRISVFTCLCDCKADFYSLETICKIAAFNEKYEKQQENKRKVTILILKYLWRQSSSRARCQCTRTNGSYCFCLTTISSLPLMLLLKERTSIFNQKCNNNCFFRCCCLQKYHLLKCM